MPLCNGLEATRRIRALEAAAAPGGRSAPAFIVGLTACAGSEDKEACYAAGMNAFLTKPLEPNILRETLKPFRIQP